MPKSVDTADIYAAAIALFCERGFGGTTTRQIADRAGINEVTLFRRFGSKAALMEAAIIDALAEAPFGQVTPSADVTSDLSTIVEAYLATYQRHGGLALTLFSQLPHHPELAGTTPALMENLQNVAGVLAHHQAQGRIRPGNPIRFAVELIAPLAMVGFLNQLGIGSGHPGLDLNDYVETYLQGHQGQQPG
ncbi:TetR/AcrR family transcriptional regulator [Roseibium sp.]|uniref:TetR/AcrR family transcriptional regulator n=1 Tax=Roseibium sp. TaxID=1936156 RepID=UPI003BB13D30